MGPILPKCWSFYTDRARRSLPFVQRSTIESISLGRFLRMPVSASLGFPEAVSLFTGQSGCARMQTGYCDVGECETSPHTSKCERSVTSACSSKNNRDPSVLGRRPALLRTSPKPKPKCQLSYCVCGKSFLSEGWALCRPGIRKT